MELEALNKIFEDNPKRQDIPVVPNVQHIILGQRSFWNWSSFEPFLPKENYLLTACRCAFDRFISAHAPQAICTHSNQDPYSLVDVFLTGSELVKTQPTVTRHVYAHYEQPDFISGAKNRWIFYPGCMTSEPDSTIYGELAPPGYDHIQDL